MRRFFVVVCLVLWINDLWSLDTLTQRVIDFPKYLHLYARLGSPFSEIEIEDPKIDESLLFKPNPQSQLGFGFSYSWLGMGVNFSLPAESWSNRKYGKTRKFDFEAHITTQRLMVDVIHKRYKGFYFSNAGDYMDDWHRGDPYPQIPNLQTNSTSVSFAYIFSPNKYSSNAAYSFSQAMRKSGGSWMAGGYCSFNGIDSDSSIVPAVVKAYIDPKLDLKNVVFSDIGLSFGYSHLFSIWRKYFVAFTFIPGLSLQNIVQQSSLDSELKKFNALSMRSVLRFSLGKNGDRCYWGVSTYLESVFLQHHKSELSLKSGHAEIFLGYRFDTSHWRFMKRVDRVMHPSFMRFITGEPPRRD